MKVYLVDAFADAPFVGNPAAVCLVPGEPDAGWMRAVARELNQPASAFAWEEGGGWRLRWYSPTSELALCGHGTLATGHVLWSTGAVEGGAEVDFRTGAGSLRCTRNDGWIAMDFPSERPVPAPAPAGLSEALGAPMGEVWRNRLDYLVVLDDAAAVRALRPNASLLAAIPTRGVIVTAPADEPGVDFVSRFFAPAFGIEEDAVTGSAHCALGPFWGARLDLEDLVGFQASQREGMVRVRPRGDRVELLGRAVTVLSGDSEIG